ncbi:SRPBCC family protein [Pseudarthrobacter sulfonivorans]|uniref:SRPBCC family protein n=1 Tax=Pseudarthrobacter sulfonivorans TaxID=121292 RepID=UPI00285E863E|nr:SRPBCC family protein [Pseudarthrobacter sulfonivorans]MDR6416426.1 hypothetical protein [Pseudarthrobacter sulfonivorans]
MGSKVEKRIVVDVPVGTAYNQWTQFEDFPHFMDGVESVTQLSDDRLKWVARIAGVRREWDATILEQVPNRRVAWASTGGVTNSGAVEFSDAGADRTEVALTLEYLPAGMLERVGDLLHVVGRQADHDLKKFKSFIEHEGHATGAWRKLAPGAWRKLAPGAWRKPAAGTAVAGAGSVAGEPVTGSAAAGTSAQGDPTRDTAESRAGDSPQEYNRFAHPFDQTGGLVDLEGESDGSADGEFHSRGDRRARRTNDGRDIPPGGGNLGDR